jgi:tetratricopeptide (TPR) repeat protein
MPNASEIKQQGLAFFQKDRLAEAAERFDQAARAYEAAAEPLEAAEARNNLAVVRLAQEDWAGALAAVQGTPQIFAAAGDRLRLAQAIANLARSEEGVGNMPEAEQNYETAIEMLTDLGEKEVRASCWKALAGVQVKLDKKLQAIASMQAGLKLQPKLNPREKTLKGLLDQAVKLMGR